MWAPGLRLDNDTWYQWKHGAIKKIDGTNYGGWQRSLRSTLRVAGAFGIATGDEQPPGGNGTAIKLKATVNDVPWLHTFFPTRVCLTFVLRSRP